MRAIKRKKKKNLKTQLDRKLYRQSSRVLGLNYMHHHSTGKRSKNVSRYKIR